MLPNPFSEVGRVYEEVRQLNNDIQNKVNNWELLPLQGRIDALSQDVRILSESIMDIYNKLDTLKNE